MSTWLASISRFLVPLTFSLFLLSGCQDNNGNRDTFNCFFLQVGYEWVYDYQQSLTSGELKVRVESENDSIYKVVKTLNGTPSTYYWFTEGAALKEYANNETKEEARVIFRCNPVTGHRWQEESTTNPGETVFYEVISVSKTIISPAGTFDNCAIIEITYSHNSNEIHSYWSDIYGKVSQDGYTTLQLLSKNF